MSRSRAQRKRRRRARPAGGSPADRSPRAARRGVPSAAAPGAPPTRFEVRDGVARPHAIWSPFPLTEIGIAAGLVIFGLGFASDGRRAIWLMAVGALVLAVVVGEQCLREHFAGFRSHTLLLAVLAVVVLHAAVFLAITDAYAGALALVVDLALGGALAWWLRRRFRAAHERAVAPGA